MTMAMVMTVTTKTMTTKDHQWQGNLLDYLVQNDENDINDNIKDDDNDSDDEDDDDKGPLVAG